MMIRDPSTYTNTALIPRRRPTPTHDAAHVLVSFQQNGPSSDLTDTSNKQRLSAHHLARRTLRPLSTANVNRPPQNRRRVWRACESCRKKKIKCDGADPCQCCLDTSNECVYAVEGYRRGFIDSQVVEVYDKRIQALEDLVSTLVEDQQRLAVQLANQRQQSDIGTRLEHTIDHRQLPVPIDFSHESLLPQPDTIPVEQEQQHIHTIPAPLASRPDTIVEPELVPSQSPPVASSIPPLPTENTHDSAQDKEEVTVPRVFKDDYGLLTTDEADGARYVGLGATVWVTDECSGVRNWIRQGLIQKGHCTQESIINQCPAFKKNEFASPLPGSNPDNLPPVALMDALIDTFFQKVYRLFPIIEAEDFQRQYLMLLSHNVQRPGFLGLLYSVLAVSSQHISQNDQVWSRDGCSGYKGLDLGGHFYSLAITAVGSMSQPLSFMLSSSQQSNNINTVIALTVLGMHLTQLGMLGEAWNTIGHAIRLGYEMGLQRSPKRMGLPLLNVKRRCQLWWCLYVMDRLLSLHLGRPIAINNSDSDVFFPSPRPQAPGFVAMTHLCRLIGRIHHMVNSIENSQKWQDASNHLELQAKIHELWVDLQNWKQQMLPVSDIEAVQDDAKLTEICVLLSSYCSAVHLLFRPFMPTPHRPSKLDSGLALTECYRAAVECIGISEAFIRTVPACHYYALHGQNLFISIVNLGHCVRSTDDAHIFTDAQDKAQQGMTLLSTMDPTWPMARQYIVIAEEYQSFTRQVLQGGKRGRCMFEDIHAEAIPLSSQDTHFDPWGEFAAQVDLESNVFPSMPDATWMSELFHLSPTSSTHADGDPLDCTTDVTAMNEVRKEEQPAAKRRRVTKNRAAMSVCAFSVKRSI